MATEAHDVVVYGNTWAAVNAACAASIESKRSLRVLLCTNYIHVGGIISNGLGEIDFGSKGTKGIGWLTQQFFNRVTKRLGAPKISRRVSPSVAELTFLSLLRFHNISIRGPLTLASVQKTGTVINSITMTDGTIFTGSQFIDGTEEGDLAKMAGVTMVTGRGLADANNTLDGFSGLTSEFVPFAWETTPGSGVPISGFLPLPSLAIGDADAGVQSYGFRLCLTNQISNKRKWPKPAGYDPALFEYLKREGNHLNANWRAFRTGMCVNGKADMNANYGGPLQWQWPEATPTQRQALLIQIYNEQAGWLWFLANDPSVHPNVQAYVNSWGLCLDERPTFGDTTLGWGKELYVRVGRRMVGKTVLNQIDTQVNVTKTNAIAMGYYSLDNHEVAKYYTTIGGVKGYIPDSFSYRFDNTHSRFVLPYQIPYSMMLPLAAEVSNLLVPVAASMSNVAASSYRIDMHKANAASAAGLCAAYAIMNAITVDAVDALVPSVIQPKLTAYGHVWQPPA